MKKIILLISIMVITIGLLGGCSFFLHPADTSIEDEIYTEYESMMDAFVEVETMEEISDYLVLWAQTLGIEAQKDRFQSVIIDTPGLESNSENPFITIECSISLDNLADDLRAVSIAMVLLKESNTETSISNPIRVLFVPYDGADYYGAKNLSSYYLKNTQMIHLNTIEPNEVITKGASSSLASIERSIKTTKPNYQMAYQITIDGFNSDFSSADFTETPNGIKELGVLFATCKSKGMLFELADFSGSSLSSFAPVSASAIMVINQNDIKSLTYYYNKMESKLTKNYIDLNPNLIVTMSAIDLPTSVLTSEDTDHLVSFIYTIFNGFCGESEDTFSLLNQVNITKSKFSCKLLILNLLAENISDENDNLNVICNLNNMNYNLQEIHKGWSQDPNSIFVKDFLEKIDKKPKETFSKSSLVEYQAKNKDMEMISYGVDLKDCEEQLSVLKNYIKSNSITNPTLN